MIHAEEVFRRSKNKWNDGATTILEFAAFPETLKPKLVFQEPGKRVLLLLVNGIFYDARVGLRKVHLCMRFL